MEVRVSKAALLCMLLVILIGRIAAQSSPADLAQQAYSLYEQGDLVGAQGLYETLIDEGIRSSAIFFNLGQVYSAVQDNGRALLMYRRAQQLEPRDTDLNLALARVRASRSDILGDETALVDSLAAATLPLLTLEELNWLMLGLWAFSFVLVGVYITNREWRSVLRAFLLAWAVLLILGFALWFSRVYTGAFRPAAVITTHTVSVMCGPGEDYLEIYALHAAAEIRLIEQRENWVHFVLPDGREGWLREGFFEKV
jgi:tetratricopeptide (TPR) repeat protein